MLLFKFYNEVTREKKTLLNKNNPLNLVGYFLVELVGFEPTS